MGESVSTKMSLDGSGFASEAKAIAQSVKSIGAEFKVMDAELKQSGSITDQLKNKYNGLQKQLERQKEVTEKYQKAVNESGKAQEQTKQKLEAANKAYADGKTKYADGSKELSKLEKNVLKNEKALHRATTQHEKYKTSLGQSKTAEQKFKSSLSDTQKELQKHQRYMTQVNESFKQSQKATESLRTGLTKTGRALTVGVTAPLVAAGAKVVKVSKEFNASLANIGTLGVSNDRLMELKSGIQEIAIEVGKDTQDISEGTYQVVSAYGDTADTLEMVKINAKAAASGLATTKDSIDLTSAVTKGYGEVNAAATQKVSDLAFETVKLGQTTFPELAASMGKVVPQAKALGASQEELFAVFATLTGVTGDTAEVSTQLGSIWTALMKPSASMTAALNKMGYESGFAAISALGLQGTLKGLVEVTGGSDEALVQLAGRKEAVTAMLALTGAQADTFSEKLVKLQNAAGATDKAFQAQTEGVNKTGFAFQQAMIQMQVAAQNFGDTAAPYIEKGADAISNLSSWLKSLDDNDRDRILKIGSVLAVLGPAMSIFGKGITAFNGVSAVVKNLGVIGAKASMALEAGSGLAGALTAIASPAGWATAIIATLTTVIGGSVIAYKHAKYEARNYGKAVLEAADDFKKAMDESDSLDDKIREWEQLNATVKDGSASAEQVTSAKERLKEVEQWLIDNYGIYLKSDTVQNRFGVTEEEIAGLKERNAQLRETAKLKAEIALQDAKEKYDKAKIGIEDVKKNRDDLQETNRNLEERKNILIQYAKQVDEINKSDDSHSDKIKQKKNLLQELNSEVEKFGIKYDENQVENLNQFADNIDYSIKKNEKNLRELNQQILEYQESGMNFQDATRQVMNQMLSDMPAETPEAFAQAAQSIIQMGQNAELSSEEMAVFANKLTEIAQAAGLIDENKKIVITAEGNLDVLDKAAEETERLNGQTANIEVDANADSAYIELDGVKYRVLDFDNTTGVAILSADGTKVDMELNTKTGEVTQFDSVTGTAKLEAIDNVTQKAKNAANALKEVKSKEITITTVFKTIGEKVSGLFKNATGTQDFSGGLAMINDQKGISDPRELVEVDGKGYIFEGRDVILPLPKHSKVYTASQTKEIMHGMGIPHYASGKDNSAFENAKAAFQHRKKTSEVTVLEELQWWNELRATIQLTAEEAEEAEEEIYSLTKQLNEDSISDYKERISDQISDGERWLNQQVKLYNISYDEQIEILNRIDKRHLETLQEMIANTEMTEKEKDDIYKEYYKAHEDRILDIADLEIKKAQEVKEAKQKLFDAQLEDSEEWTSDRNYYNDWAQFGDDPLAAYQRVKSRFDAAIAEETYPEKIKDLKKQLKEFGQDMYDQRREDSKRWMETEEYYGDMTVQKKLDCIDRQRAYTLQYYQAGMISHREYLENMDELDKEYFSAVKEQMEDTVSEYYQAQKEQLEAKKQAIEDEYALISSKEKQQDRASELEKLRKRELIFSNAVTIEGRQKLQEIQERIAELEDEALQEQRDDEKEKRLASVDDEMKRLDEEEQKALKRVSKYAQDMTKKVFDSNDESTKAFNRLMHTYADQQVAIAQTGYDNLTKIVNMTNQKLNEIIAAEQRAEMAKRRIDSMASGYGNAGAQYNYSLYQTNNNIVQDAFYGELFGRSAARAFMNTGKGR